MHKRMQINMHVHAVFTLRLAIVSLPAPWSQKALSTTATAKYEVPTDEP
jgi:hypothetical protein